MTLSDIDPSGVEVARCTAALNGLEDLVTVYESDVLDQIPPSDAGISSSPTRPTSFPTPPNPTASSASTATGKCTAASTTRSSPTWKPGGLVAMVENTIGADRELFAQMIAEGAAGSSPTTREPATTGGRTAPPTKSASGAEREFGEDRVMV